MQELLTYLVKTLVNSEDEVEVTRTDDEKTITFHVKVASSDLGKVIGKNGKMADCIRTIIKSIGAKEHKKVFVKFED